MDLGRKLPKTLTADDVAMILGISKNLVLQFIGRKLLLATPGANGAWTIARDDYVRFLRERWMVGGND
jgi:hypothetical protein